MGSQNQSMEVKNIKTTYCLTFDIDDLAARDIESKSVTMNGVLWKVRLCKRTTDDEDTVDIYLICIPNVENINMKWNCEAQVTFKLLAFDSDDEETETLPKTEFNNNCLMHGIRGFKNWDELIKPENHFVREKINRATLEIELQTGPLNFLTPEGMDITSTKVLFFMDNISENHVQNSPEVIVRGIRWAVSAEKTCEYLTVCLHAREDDLDRNWYWRVNYSVRIVSFDDEVNKRPNIHRSEPTNYRWGASVFGFSEFMKWTDFIHPCYNYIEQKTAVLELDLSVDAPRPLWDT